MKYMNRITLCVSLCMLALFCSCDEERDIRWTTVEIDVWYPSDLSGISVESETFEFRNITSGMVTSFTTRKGITLPEGLYDCSYEDDFIIEEIFFTGTLQSSGKQYYGDGYVKIYNNTDHMLYADGVALMESKFVTTQKFDYTPDIMSTHMTVQAVYVIPGSGTDHPVAPGESFILCDTGIDHRIANPNSFDLSRADYEWYDESSVPAHLDIDSPTVPNLDKWYCYTKSFGFSTIGDSGDLP